MIEDDGRIAVPRTALAKLSFSANVEVLKVVGGTLLNAEIYGSSNMLLYALDGFTISI
jgi:hypothetical protein